MKIKIPEIIIEGKKYYYDIIRKKYVQSTPEEKVRQTIVRKLVSKGIPLNMIDIEEPLSHYDGIEDNKRMDIVVHMQIEEELYPVMVIECKRDNLILGHEERNQLLEYARRLNIAYAWLSNGTDHLYYGYEEDSATYKKIRKLPSYIEILDGFKADFIPENPQKTRVFTSIHEELLKFPNEYHLYNIRDWADSEGWDSVEEWEWYNVIDLYTWQQEGYRQYFELAQLCLNLNNCLMDTSSEFTPRESDIFTFISDKGLRFSKYSNASGSDYTGYYRCFEIEYFGTTDLLTLRLQASHGRCTAVCAGMDRIGSKEGPHHAFQYNTSLYLDMHGRTGHFLHSGSGSGDMESFKKYIKHMAPHLLTGEKGKEINLGYLKSNHLFKLEDPDISDFLTNYIECVLLLEKFRSITTEVDKKI